MSRFCRGIGKNDGKMILDSYLSVDYFAIYCRMSLPSSNNIKNVMIYWKLR